MNLNPRPLPVLRSPANQPGQNGDHVDWQSHYQQQRKARQIRDLQTQVNTRKIFHGKYVR